MNSPAELFCRRCGSKMTEGMFSGRMRPVYPECGFVLYRNPIPGIGVLVEMEGGVVLICRGHDPHRESPEAREFYRSCGSE